MNITLLPDYISGDPEASAMIQAFYSRSHKPIEERLASLGEDLSSIKESLAKYYIQYGHSSIGDLGDVTVFIENVSLLAAKLIQNFPLYNGQESSTRYIDFTKQSWTEDLEKPELSSVIPDWLDFVSYLSPKIEEYFTEINFNNFTPSSKDEEDTLRRAIKAKTFDIVRGFLPCGLHTQLSLKTSLRKAQEHMNCIRHINVDGSNEVKDLAELILNKLRAKFPSSFYSKDDPRNELSNNRHNYVNFMINDYSSNFYRLYGNTKLTFVPGEDFSIPLHRNKKDPIPLLLDMLGDVYFEVLIDVGCWRDLQRHRRILSPMPYFGVNSTENFEIHSWYINSLPDYLQEETLKFCCSQFTKINEAYQATNFKSQYYLPLGTAIVSKHKAPLSALIYMLELRSKLGVHPLLRNLVHDLYHKLKLNFEVHNWVNHPDIYMDLRPDTNLVHINRGNDVIKNIVTNEVI